MKNQKTNNEIINVCCGNEISSENAINEISHQLGKDLTIREIGGYVGDQDFISGRNDKLKSFGWAPKKNLTSGVCEFLENL